MFNSTVLRFNGLAPTLFSDLEATGEFQKKNIAKKPVGKKIRNVKMKKMRMIECRIWNEN